MTVMNMTLHRNYLIYMGRDDSISNIGGIPFQILEEIIFVADNAIYST